MTIFLWNLVLMFIWAAMTANFSLSNLLFGFVLSYVILLFSQRVIGHSSYLGKIFQVVRFGLYFIWQLIVANYRVAFDVVTPTLYMKPGVLAIPLDLTSDTQITLLANIITLTPGTLSLDVSDDRKVLYIHAMFIDDPEELRREIKEGFERRILELSK